MYKINSNVPFFTVFAGSLAAFFEINDFSTGVTIPCFLILNFVVITLVDISFENHTEISDEILMKKL